MVVSNFRLVSILLLKTEGMFSECDEPQEGHTAASLTAKLKRLDLDSEEGSTKQQEHTHR